MGRLGIIAASGTFPMALAEAAIEKGETPFIIRLSGHCDHAFPGYDSIQHKPGQLNAITKTLLEAGCDRVMLAGKFNRPALRDLNLDWAGAALLGKLALKGDDAALRLLSDHFAQHGLQIMANSSYLPEQLIDTAYHYGRALTSGEQAAVALGQQVLASLGGLDVGQSVIVQQQRIIAVEAAEGTDAMIARAALLIDASADAAVFVKMAKSGQHTGLDMPVIGCETIAGLAKAGIQVAAAEARHVMLAEPLQRIEAALEQHGVVLTAQLDGPSGTGG